MVPPPRKSRANALPAQSADPLGVEDRPRLVRELDPASVRPIGEGRSNLSRAHPRQDGGLESLRWPGKENLAARVHDVDAADPRSLRLESAPEGTAARSHPRRSRGLRLESHELKLTIRLPARRACATIAGVADDLSGFDRFPVTAPVPPAADRSPLFRLGRTPVTNAQYDVFLSACPDVVAPPWRSDPSFSSRRNPSWASRGTRRRRTARGSPRRWAGRGDCRRRRSGSSR